MDYLSIIREPITAELSDFIRMFNHSLEHENGLLQQALDHIRQRAGKRMRPILIRFLWLAIMVLSPMSPSMRR